MENPELHESLLADPKFWVAVAFFIFIGAFGKILWKHFTKAMDGRTLRIKTELDDARRLREEAQAALDAYRKKHAESLQEAESILAQARKDAQLLVVQAQAELKRLLEIRVRMAEEKIARAEKQAIDEVRDHVVDITIAAAKAIIMENIQQMPGDDLIRKAIADIERKVH